MSTAFYARGERQNSGSTTLCRMLNSPYMLPSTAKTSLIDLSDEEKTYDYYDTVNSNYSNSLNCSKADNSSIL